MNAMVSHPFDPAQRIAELEAQIAECERLIGELSGKRSDQAELPLRRAFPLVEFSIGHGLTIPLPDTLQDVANVIGRYAAVRLSEGLVQTGKRASRRMVYVPATPPQRHRLIDLIGVEARAKLCWTHGRIILGVPVCQKLKSAWRDLAAKRMADSGMKPAQIAADLGTSEAVILAALGAQS
ncbi:MAG: hypothetical protein NXH97_05380 [Rhodobacteraceae bacterium]|nr:hypothetical protein [Paracoccaceae bacterium]